MAYKIPSLPSPRAYKEEKADFWEIEAIRNPGQFISQLHVLKALSKELDEINHEGIVSEEDVVDEELSDVFNELQDRITNNADRYPFEFGRYSIRLKEESNNFKKIYLFLLLCTRFNMKAQKVHNGVDGTLLFENICASIAKNYFGKSAKSIVFGTAEPGNFEEKVKHLITSIGEGGGFKNPNNHSPTKNDAAIDVVVWKEFSDKRFGKLIGFGQCKTGTHWRDEIHQLKPKDFCDNWLRVQPVFDPLSLVFICDTMNYDFNFYTSQKGFLIFNRNRILEYFSDGLDERIQEQLDNWLEGALAAIEVIN